MADQLDYRIIGEEMQLVEIELDPQETVIAEAGAMNYMDDGIVFETVMGDGSNTGGGFFEKAIGAGKRVLTGESLFMTHFSNRGTGKKKVAFAAPYPGKIIPIHLQTIGGTFICQKDAFLCAARGTRVDITFTKSLGTGLFGGEGFILEKLHGDGVAFIHAGGTVIRRDLDGERLFADTGCLVGFTAGIDYRIQRSGNLRSMLFGGEGMFLAELAGRGTVYLQSLPFRRLAARILQQIPPGGSSKGEGSALGSLGNMFMGDR